MHRGHHSAVPLLLRETQANPAPSVRSHSATSGLRAGDELVCASMLTTNPVIVCAEGFDFRDGHTLRVIEVNVPFLDPVLSGRRKEMLATDNKRRYRVRVRLNCLAAFERSVPNLNCMIS